MSTLLLLTLFLLPPMLAIIYGALEHLGLIDKLAGRDLALRGFDRLRSTSGYPESWIHNEGDDEILFAKLERRISSRTASTPALSLIAEGCKPRIITVGGQPAPINGLPDDWPQGERTAYSPNHPVMYIFDVPGSQTGQKITKVCTLCELELWLREEKERRVFWLGVVVLSLFSICLIVLRFGLSSYPIS